MVTPFTSVFVRDAVVALGFATLMAAPVLAETTLRFAHFSVEDDRNHRVATEPANMVPASTGGEVKIAISQLVVATFNVFGTNATAIAYPEVYSALQTGTVPRRRRADSCQFLTTDEQKRLVVLIIQ